MTEVPSHRVIAEDLRFPEGPIAMADGSVVFVEIRRQTLSRAGRDGKVEVIAQLSGGPNGAAIGPDGAVYLCNNGGIKWVQVREFWLPSRDEVPDDYAGGWIERVDLRTGNHSILYRECDGVRLRSPNDLVFDDQGGFYFTDMGKTLEWSVDQGAVFYARADGSSIQRAIHPLHGPNGIGLSPDGGKVIVAETHTGRLWAYDLESPGVPAGRGRNPRCLANTLGHFDSLAIEAGGNAVVAAIAEGLCIATPAGELSYVPMPDNGTTNICFGGDDGRTAYVTLSGGGRLIETRWPRPGLKLAYGA